MNKDEAEKCREVLDEIAKNSTNNLVKLDVVRIRTMIAQSEETARQTDVIAGVASSFEVIANVMEATEKRNVEKDKKP